MITHYLNFLKVVPILTSCKPLDALTLNLSHEMENILLTLHRETTASTRRADILQTATPEKT